MWPAHIVTMLSAVARLSFLASLLGLACCASPAAEESANSDDAISVGTAFTSSLDEGFYDQGGSSLFVDHDVTEQTLDFSTYIGANHVFCNGRLDVPLTGEHAHEMRLDDTKNGCALSFSTSAGQIRVQGHIDYQTHSGDIDVTLSPRKADAYAGTFGGIDSSSIATVTASTNDMVTMSVTLGGQVIAANQAAMRDDGFADFTLDATSDCPLSVTLSTDSDGVRWINVWPAYNAKSAKCPPGLPAAFWDR